MTTKPPHGSRDRSEGHSEDRAPLKILVVDDQPGVVDALGLLFELHGLAYVAAADPAEALRIAGEEPLGAIVQDMNFRRNETSGEAGIDLFHRLREIQPGVPILLMTAWASLETAVELVRDGASDYIEKPWNDEKLVATLRNLVRMRRLELENETLRGELEQSRGELERQHDLRGIVYASDAMLRVVRLAVSVADSDAAVMITGPSGSGKERIAEIVQANSARRERPFVRVNVGAIPEELIESELFGAEPGAYTGIQGRRIGHFESADGGTLFLDEVDTLSLAGQVKLLRVLQSGEFRRLGSSRTHTGDVRVISASNTQLKQALADGRFRDDLFFRLNVVEIAVPSLVDRRDDIVPLAEHFLREYSASTAGTPPLEIGADARRALLEHSWPGNVRELENRIQRATVVARTTEISAADLGIESPVASARLAELDAAALDERQRLVTLLAEESGVVARAAARIGISRQALYRRMARLAIELERRPKA